MAIEIQNNDAALVFFDENGYPVEYNDGMLAWLRDVYDDPDASLDDLFQLYIIDNGETFEPADDFNVILVGGDTIITSDAAFVTLPGVSEPTAPIIVIGSDTFITSDAATITTQI